MSGTAKFVIGFVVLAILAWVAGATLSSETYRLNKHDSVCISGKIQ